MGMRRLLFGADEFADAGEGVLVNRPGYGGGCDLHRTLSRGGTTIEVPGYNGSWVKLNDGTRIGLRDASKSGGRAIDIKMPDGTSRKVHIGG